jgi:hypothetical protein
MIGPNQRMGRKFVISTHLNYPFYKWEVGQTLEATLLTPSNIPPPVYGGIYYLLLGPLDKLKTI